MDTSQITFDWDAPIPFGVGKSNKWRKFRESMNRLVSDKKKKVSAIVVLGADATDADLTRTANCMRSAFYNWRAQLPDGNREAAARYRTTTLITGSTVQMFVYDRGITQ